jgi:hypothetical protein
LNDGALPRDRHRQQQRVEAGIVKALPDVATRREHRTLTVIVAARQSLVCGAILRRAHIAEENDRLVAAVGESLRQPFEVIASFGEDERTPALGGQRRRVLGDQLRPPVVGGERSVDLLNVWIGGQRLCIEGGVPPHDAERERS